MKAADNEECRGCMSYKRTFHTRAKYTLVHDDGLHCCKIHLPAVHVCLKM